MGAIKNSINKNNYVVINWIRTCVFTRKVKLHTSGAKHIYVEDVGDIHFHLFGCPVPFCVLPLNKWSLMYHLYRSLSMYELF